MPIAVSYTHLDVYKRQGEGLMQTLDKIIKSKYNWSMKQKIKVYTTSICPYCITPVSYTHLE